MLSVDSEDFDCTSSTQLTRSTISFEEEVEEEESLDTVSDFRKYISVFAVASIVVVACFLAFILRRTSDGDGLLQIVCQRAEETAKEFFGGSRKISSLFCYAGKFLLTDKSKCCGCQRPLVLLLVGRNSQTSLFLEQFRLFTEKLGPEPLDYTVSALEPPSRRELEKTVFNHLKNNRILILRGIDRLKSTAPLVLQSITDPESSPFKDALIVATLSPTNLMTEKVMESSVKRCDEKIFGYLLRRWSSDEMRPDSVIPIISRISANAHCFE